MKKINRNKLNNKGFTLIELLAVVVILAVVMGIAMTSVLSSMNKARGGSLEDTAMVIAKAFTQKYTESLVDGVPSDVYGDVLKSTVDVKKGYSFQSSAVYYLDKGLADAFNISEDGYAFVNSDKNEDKVAAQVANIEKTGESLILHNSFVSFDASNGKFIVCMFANKKGSYFVDNYKVVNTAKKIMDAANGLKISGAASTMYACSDGTTSW